MIKIPERNLSTIEEVYEDGMLAFLIELRSSIPIYKKQIELRKSLPENVVPIRVDALTQVIRTINNFNLTSMNLSLKCGTTIKKPFPLLPENDIDELERIIESLFGA